LCQELKFTATNPENEDELDIEFSFIVRGGLAVFLEKHLLLDCKGGAVSAFAPFMHKHTVRGSGAGNP